jgi:zinc transporter ZupT
MAYQTILLLFCVFLAIVTFLLSHCLAKTEGYTYRHIDLWEGFKKYTIKMGSDVMIFIPHFIKICSAIQRWGRGEIHANSMAIA